jgi:ergothioneine biosynthesis protein EgtB
VDRDALLDAYRSTRALTLELARPLRPEDWRVQSMSDVSPPWWNLGHTSWFFAKNVLEPAGRYLPEDTRLEYVLNSYYEALGPRLRRDRRGLVTRPTNAEVLAFRASVDERLEELLRSAPEGATDLDFQVTLGIQHEQQHQELLLTEVKHILGSNVPELREPYHEASPGRRRSPDLDWVPVDAGLHDFGNLEGGWCWDNELAVHRAWLDGFALASRLVTNREYLEFIADGGYREPLLWLANGWAQVEEQGWTAPLYWSATAESAEAWRVWTLAGERDLDPEEPVGHVSFYEADAFARWRSAQGGESAGARLPTEREWEQAARATGFAGDNFLDSRLLHPRPPERDGGRLLQMGGDLWEWTASHYEPYPGYRPFPGAVQEYNGKFMDNQRVLRGGSCATPRSHIRPSYRNFWPAGTRFQFTGIRLAKDQR